MIRKHRRFNVKQARTLPSSHSMRVLSRYRIQVNYHRAPTELNRRNLFFVRSRSRRIPPGRVCLAFGGLKVFVVAGSLSALKKFLPQSISDLQGREMHFAGLGQGGRLKLRAAK